MYNILLLGGTGFIGKNIIESFYSDKKCNLIVVSRDPNLLENPIFLGDNITVKIGSLLDSDFIENLIDDYKINVIIHLASSLIPSSSESAFFDGMSSIIIPTFKLIDFIANREIKFIFFSSGGTIYGNASFLIKETNSLNPINNYGFSKLIIENYIKYKSNSSRLNYIILRPSNVYGKYQSFDGNQGFISVAVNRIHHDKTIEIWGDGSSVRDYIDVIDVVIVLKKLLFNSISNVILNLSTGVGLSLLQIIKIIENNLKKQAVINFNNKRIVDVNVVILDNSKLLEIIDHEFVPVVDGINNQINYFNTTI